MLTDSIQDRSSNTYVQEDNTISCTEYKDQTKKEIQDSHIQYSISSVQQIVPTCNILKIVSTTSTPKIAIERLKPNNFILPKRGRPNVTGVHLRRKRRKVHNDKSSTIVESPQSTKLDTEIKIVNIFDNIVDNSNIDLTTGDDSQPIDLSHKRNIDLSPTSSVQDYIRSFDLTARIKTKDGTDSSYPMAEDIFNKTEYQAYKLSYQDNISRLRRFSVINREKANMTMFLYQKVLMLEYLDGIVKAVRAADKVGVKIDMQHIERVVRESARYNSFLNLNDLTTINVELIEQIVKIMSADLLESIRAEKNFTIMMRNVNDLKSYIQSLSSKREELYSRVKSIANNANNLQ